ncbi:MAG: bacteriocin [Cyanobacteria bacterium TMED177]|nr:MAG: bacteriocin [Cyanobacteria bacterium TMED177]
MSLDQLDRFLALRASNAVLAEQLASPLDLHDFLDLAREWGYNLTESDVLDAQQRAMEQGSASALQRAQASDSRRLRNFIHG